MNKQTNTALMSIYELRKVVGGLDPISDTLQIKKNPKTNRPTVKDVNYDIPFNGFKIIIWSL